jgi:hypothetical protein
MALLSGSLPDFSKRLMSWRSTSPRQSPPSPRTYYLHPAGQNLLLPLTELEVRGTRIPCPTCAVLVHIDHQRYLTVSPGRLSCTHGTTVLLLNLSLGQQIDLHPEDNCVIEAVHIGRQMLRLQDFEIDTTGDKAVDTLLTAKISQKDAQVETMVAMKDAHSLLNMKLRQDVSMAQEDISTFVEDTSLAVDSVTLTTSFSLGGVAIVTVVVILIVLCIVCRCRAARAASRAAAASRWPSSPPFVLIEIVVFFFSLI